MTTERFKDSWERTVEAAVNGRRPVVLNRDTDEVLQLRAFRVLSIREQREDLLKHIINHCVRDVTCRAHHLAVEYEALKEPVYIEVREQKT